MSKKTNQVEVRTVKRETMYMVAVLALAVGFFGGVVFSVVSSDTAPPGQSFAPVQSSPMPQASVDLSGAIAMMEKAVAANPNDVKAWIGLGNNYFDTGQHEKSIQAYRKSLALDPNNPDVWTDMGIMYRRSGNPQEAIRSFDKAIEVDPNHKSARFNKGIVYLHDLNDTRAAIQAWEDLMKIDPFARTPGGQSVDQMVAGLKKQLGQQGPSN
jgi:cytochrome c-type biogenesis protein CcmH/NrfG